jgi:superfamily II DNA or RNA helicase
MVQRYIADFKARKTTGSALVHLPTGTGKSGIIAVLARAVPEVKGVLVLTPRIALRDQLANDIDGRFFQRLFPPADPKAFPKTVVCLDGEPTARKKENPESKVYVSTIQLFYAWSERQTDFHKLFLTSTDLVLVDEGHYETAPNWQQAIRALNCPKVLFTATPYRNDLKVFDVDFDHAVSLSHTEAVRKNYLRDLRVHRRSSHDNDPVRFIEDVLAFYDATFPGARRQAPAKQPRVIIRCDAHDHIRQIAEALQTRGRSVVAVHERFRTDALRPHERRHVPDPATEPAIFWVHQFKLLEGLDDERFQVVAAFDELGNARSLVQQVGRALRNRGRRTGQTAHLLDHCQGRLDRLWAGYLEYDQYLSTAGPKSTLQPGQEMFDAWMKGVRQTVYLDGTFRSPLQLEAFNPVEGLQLPRTVNVYRKDPAFDLPRLGGTIGRVCVEDDLVHKVWPIDADTVVALYVVQENSPLLRDDFFMDSKLAAVVVRQAGDFVFVLDTGGKVHCQLPSLGSPVAAKDLRKLFRQAKAGRITHVSVRNSTLAPDAIRTRVLSARAIHDTAPFPDDRNSVCSTLEGYAPLDGAHSEVVRRYLGFGRGKISDYGGGYVPLPDYLAWLEYLATGLRSSARPRRELSRYALEVTPPADCTPTHVLLDLGEAIDRYVCTDHPTAQDSRPLQAEDWCASVSGNSRGEKVFPLTANGKKFEIEIKYISPRCRYELACPDLDSYYRSQDTANPEGFVRYLNDTQAFRVLPRTPGYFYTLGQFYHPEASFGPAYDDEQLGVLKVLHPVARLATTGSEKGAPSISFGRKTWPADCLFGLIDAAGKGTEMATHFGTPDLVVCDDMSTEAADFLVANTTHAKVVFIHAKASGKVKTCSASAMTEVCGQAVKNTKFLSKFNDQDAPSKAPRWHTDPWKNGVNSLDRIRKGSGTGSDLWKQFRAVIRNPLSDVEVWIIAGQLLSKSQFEAHLKKSPPNQEAVQLAYLLLSTITSVTAVGAKLRVFCSP